MCAHLERESSAIRGFSKLKKTTMEKSVGGFRSRSEYKI